MIQIITYDVSKYKDYPETLYKVSKLGEIQALDDFEICVIDLSNEYIWRYNGTQPTNVNCCKDLLTIKEAIINSKITTILIILPQNVDFYYNRDSEYVNGRYQYSLSKVIQLKDNKENLIKIINNNLLNIENIKISFEKTKTIVTDKDIQADFNFSNYQEEFKPITLSKNSNKVTTIQKDKILLTTLNILKNNDTFKVFIQNCCKEKDKKEEIPEWIKDIKFYNDEQFGVKIDFGHESVEML